jgi:hypothetical protein
LILDEDCILLEQRNDEIIKLMNKMETIPTSGRLVWIVWCLLMLQLSTCRSFEFVGTIRIRSSDVAHRKSYNDFCKVLHMSPSLDDAALLGRHVFQVVIDASPIGLPVAGLAAAFVLSKSGIQQREDLRTEVEQVQTNIIKKSEEAAIAGKASKVRGEL